MKTLLLILLICAFSPDVISAQAKEDKIEIRTLDKHGIEKFGLGSGVTILENAEDVEKLLGKQKDPEAAKKIAAQADFSKEKILLVMWLSGGPPFGSIKHDVKRDGKDVIIEFHVQPPADDGSGIRNQALKGDADFFAVPKNIWFFTGFRGWFSVA